MSFYQNCCKPEGKGGKLMVTLMNCGHGFVSNWGFKHIQIKESDTCLDVGCGGGANVKRLLKKSKKVVGLDYSEVCVEKTKSLNKKEIQQERCEVIQGNVMDLPFEEGTFNVVTAFETIYFWTDLTKSFEEVYKVLQEGGTFLCVNEYNKQTASNQKYVDMIEGMTIHSTQEVVSELEKVGFQVIQYDENKLGWMCVVATK